eukprot:gene8720-18031_t
MNNILTGDMFSRVCDLLSVPEVTILHSLNKTLSESEDVYVWKRIFDNGSHYLKRQLKGRYYFLGDSEFLYKQLAKDLWSTETLKYVCWEPIQYCGSEQLRKMECHTVSILHDRFLVFVEGWGPGSCNGLSVIDSAIFPRIKKMKAATRNVPYFRYSYSTTVLSSTQLLVFGGFSSGGYRQEVTDTFLVTLSFFESHDPIPNDDEYYTTIHEGDESSLPPEPTNRTYLSPEYLSSIPINPEDSSRMSMDAVYSPLTCHTTESCPLARGFHSAVNISLHIEVDVSCRNWSSSSHSQLYSQSATGSSADNIKGLQRPCMLVWGGIHQRHPIGNLQALRLDSLAWIQVPYSGLEPSPRFGHSCILLNNEILAKDKKTPVRRLVFIGGSDGSDLIRNGRELHDVHVLTIIPGDGNATDTLVWSTPMLLSTEGGGSLATFPGRCHSACLVGDKRICCFGGGAHNSNSVAVLDLEGLTLGSSLPNGTQPDAINHPDGNKRSGYVVVRKPVVHGWEPRCRVSSVGAMVGRWLFVQGGWNNECSELRDIQLLDLTYTANARRFDPNGEMFANQDLQGDSINLRNDDKDEDEDEDYVDVNYNIDPSFYRNQQAVAFQALMSFLEQGGGTGMAPGLMAEMMAIMSSQQGQEYGMSAGDSEVDDEGDEHDEGNEHDESKGEEEVGDDESKGEEEVGDDADAEGMKTVDQSHLSVKSNWCCTHGKINSTELTFWPPSIQQILQQTQSCLEKQSSGLNTNSNKLPIENGEKAKKLIFTRYTK